MKLGTGHKACSGCGLMIGFKNVLNMIPQNSILVLSSGCLKQILTDYPKTALSSSTIFCEKYDAISTAIGIYKNLIQSNNKKQVFLILEDDYFESEFNNLNLILEEKAFLKVIVLDTRGVTSQGFNIKSFRNFYAKQMIDKGFFYSASSSISDLKDLKNKVLKITNHRLSCFLQVYTSCPQGWGVKPEKSMDIVRKGVLSGYYPILEYFKDSKNDEIVVDETILKEFFNEQEVFLKESSQKKDFLIKKAKYHNKKLNRI